MGGFGSHMTVQTFRQVYLSLCLSLTVKVEQTALLMYVRTIEVLCVKNGF